jgi:hypothetical protein
MLATVRPLGPVRSWVGLGAHWVWSGGSNLAPGPLGSVAGDPDRHRGWLPCPPSVPAAAAGRGRVGSTNAVVGQVLGGDG